MGALFRIHEQPDPERVEEFCDLVASLGYRMPGDLEDDPARGLPARPAPDRGQARGAARVLPAAAHDEARALPRGEPRPLRPGHRHVRALHEPHPPLSRTSSCTARCARCAGARAAEDVARERLAEMGRHLSERERIATEAERELTEWKKVRFMADKLGERLPRLRDRRAVVRPVRRARGDLRPGPRARVVDERRLLPLRRAGPHAHGREHRQGLPAGRPGRGPGRAGRPGAAARSTSRWWTCSSARAARGRAAGRGRRPRRAAAAARAERDGGPPQARPGSAQTTKRPRRSGSAAPSRAHGAAGRAVRATRVARSARSRPRLHDGSRQRAHHQEGRTNDAAGSHAAFPSICPAAS